MGCSLDCESFVPGQSHDVCLSDDGSIIADSPFSLSFLINHTASAARYWLAAAIARPSERAGQAQVSSYLSLLLP